MFLKEDNDIGLLDTCLPNVFIDYFMPGADGDFVKVFISGYKLSQHPKLGNITNNKMIASKLQLSIETVVNAWYYWQSCGLIDIQENFSGNPEDFDVRFLDLKKIYIENFCKIDDGKIHGIVDHESELNLEMFKKIENIIGRLLLPKESTFIISCLNEYNITREMILFAFEKSVDSKGKFKSIKYLQKIILNWKDQNITTIEQAKDYDFRYSERNKRYSNVFRLMGFSRIPSIEEKNIIDVWFDEYNYNLDVVTLACSKSANTSNPSIKYINGVIEMWHKENLKTLEDVSRFEDELKKSKEKNKGFSINKNRNEGKFSNFNDRIKSGEYDTETLEILQKKNSENICEIKTDSEKAEAEENDPSQDYLAMLKDKINSQE